MILEAANPDVQNRYYTAQEVKELPVSVIGRVLSCKRYSKKEPMENYIDLHMHSRFSDDGE